MAVGASEPAAAQSEPLTHEAQLAVVARVGELLRARYVFPEVAARCVEHLRDSDASGVLDGATDPAVFSQRLTDLLRSSSGDQHLLVRVRSTKVAAAAGGPNQAFLSRAQRTRGERQRNFGFERLERLEGNVGYLDLRFFAGAPEAQATAEAAMAFLAHSDALIVDLRHNGGGFPHMVQFLCSYLFAERTHLNSLYFREGDRTEEYWTHEVSGAKLIDVPVFVLTSAETFSGAEEFSYNLQTRERATLVGETTRGGANPGGVFAIDAHFEMVIPLGRAINPVTGTNWEGTGVVPHVTVAADLALETALELARPAAEVRRAARQALWDALEAGLTEAARLDEANESEPAAQVLAAALRSALAAHLLDEGSINMLGYDYLQQGRSALAIATFKVNTELFPRSSNAFDSLGEAYRGAGDLERALISFERAIEVDPKGPYVEPLRAAIHELKAQLKARTHD